MKKVLAFLSGVTMMVSCADKSPKTLILYYSQAGSTEAVATELQKQTGYDIAKFDVVEAYDGDYDATIQRCLGERSDGTVPTLAPLGVDLSKYDVIFLGYPIWFGSYAPPVKALIAGADLSGKKIVPFCTFGSGGLENSVKDLREALPDSEIMDGFGIRAARIQYAAEELDRFLVENGYKEGTVEALPEYSQQDVITPEELATYQEATSDYPMPIGEPVSVGSRTVPGGVDFLFVINTTDASGNVAEGKVYVARRNGRRAEFTRVVR